MKIIYILLLLPILLFSCKKESSPVKSEGDVQLLIYGNVYNFKLKRDGIDNFAMVTTTSDGGKYTTLTAIDADTFDNETSRQLRLMIGFTGSTAGDYTFHVDPNDSNTPQASISINLSGEHLNDMFDFISWETGILTITEVGKTGGYIEGAIDGKFKDTQLGNGMPIQNMPETTIHGTFKIYRSK